MEYVDARVRAVTVPTFLGIPDFLRYRMLAIINMASAQKACRGRHTN